MENLSNTLSIHFAPMIEPSWFIALCVAVAVLTLIGLGRKRKATFWRMVLSALVLLFLSNPSLLEEERSPVKDVAFVIVDHSPSQRIEDRQSRTETALSAIRQQFENRDDIELRVIESNTDPLASETQLFSLLEQYVSDTPPQRRAGVLILSDGQIHDVPQNPDAVENYGPISVLLSGRKDEIDRQIQITQAPSYGIVGQNVRVTFSIEDIGVEKTERALLTIRNNNQDAETLFLETGKTHTLDFPIRNAGQNIFEFSVEGLEGEISKANNKSGLIVNGVRDRLRVLLVSGQPHIGGRTWRDLLTSDPSVDLIHFTILREPNKLDATPQNELSLIAFPFRELFEIKLYDFDLIIFDRYKLNRILPSYYFNNIADYVSDGGALLVASGPDFAGDNSVYFTSLMDVLPAAPTGEIVQEKFHPVLNDLGKQHPVTNALAWNTAGQGADNNIPGWGSWMRQIVLESESGQILMEGAYNKPLLILDRVQEGRIAQIASDHIWLWSRGYEGGGPHSELLRRIVHWLMKEPQLDERALSIAERGDEILVKSIDLEDKNKTISMTRPDGSEDTLELTKREDGISQTRVPVDQIGIYSFEDGYGEKSFIHIGDINAREVRHVHTSAAPLSPVINASKGGVVWLSENETPAIRILQEGTSRFGGDGWAGLQQNNEYSVAGLTSTSLIPPYLGLVLLLGFATLMWWREGKS